MRLIQFTTDMISKVAIGLAALILIYAVCHILLETILRSLFGTSTHVLDEFVGFAVMSITFLSLAWTLRSGAMIRVTLVIDKLPDSAVRILEFLVATMGFLVVSSLSIFLFRNMAKDWDRGAVSNSVAEIPLWIPGLVAFVGATILAAQLLMRALGTAVGPYEREAHVEEAL